MHSFSTSIADEFANNPYFQLVAEKIQGLYLQVASQPLIGTKKLPKLG